jgi:hypothetical protein
MRHGLLPLIEKLLVIPWCLESRMTNPVLRYGFGLSTAAGCAQISSMFMNLRASGRSQATDLKGIPAIVPEICCEFNKKFIRQSQKIA